MAFIWLVISIIYIVVFIGVMIWIGNTIINICRPGVIPPKEMIKKEEKHDT